MILMHKLSKNNQIFRHKMSYFVFLGYVMRAYKMLQNMGLFEKCLTFLDLTTQYLYI